jgi:hypothetical protein
LQIAFRSREKVKLIAPPPCVSDRVLTNQPNQDDGSAELRQLALRLIGPFSPSSAAPDAGEFRLTAVISPVGAVGRSRPISDLSADQLDPVIQLVLN